MSDATYYPVFSLDDYQPQGAREIADVSRVRQLFDSSDNPWLRTSPLHATASAVVVHPEPEQVLLRWHQRQQAWLQVGGHGDPGEHDPLAIALREGYEETGLPDLRAWPTGELRHVAIVPVPANSKEPAHEHADLRYVLATDNPAAARPEKPNAPLRWLSIAEAYEATSEDNFRETLSRVASLFADFPRRS